MDLGSFGILGIYTATFFLGIMHAVEPGHGKTVVAAYLVGTKGKSIDAVLLGLVVTFTHTFSIVVLAVIAKYTSKYYSEEVLHSYLGIISSVIIMGLGLWMIKTRWSALKDPSKAHHHKHLFHSHSDRGRAPTCGADSDHDHYHQHDNSQHHPPASLTSLILLGISGGIIPCPAAIAILLASVSTGNVGKGLWLVLLFSVGLALSLVLIGLIIVNSVRVGQRFVNTEKFAPIAALLSAAVITFIGILTLYSSVMHFSI